MKRIAIRRALTASEALLCLLAAYSGYAGYPIAGFFIAIVAVSLAWAEGTAGWGEWTPDAMARRS
jgi:hypothetical protein